MSLYNDISEGLALKGVSSNSFGGAASAGVQAMTAQVNANVDPEVQKYAAFGVSKVASFMNGGSVANVGGIGQASADGWWNTPAKLIGGITPKDAQEIYLRARNQRRVKKNLWLIEVSSKLNSGEQNIPSLFNLFATEVSYSPCILTGEPVKVGGANYDVVQGTEPSELTITTMDDEEGTIKKWFSAHHHAAVARDGTMSEPASYAITVKILHGFITRDSAPESAFESIGLFRPTNMELSLSRSEDGLEEIQMTFAQLDTFMRP